MAARQRWARFQSLDGVAGFGILDGDHITEYAGDMFAGPLPTGNTVRLDACIIDGVGSLKNTLAPVAGAPR